MASIIENLTSGLKGILSILDYLNPLSDKFILKGVIDFLISILSYINPFSDDFILKGVLNFLGNLLSYINPFSDNFFGYKIVELFKNLFSFIFIPNESSYSDIIDLVKTKLGFIDSIKIAFNSIKDMINGVISIPNLSFNINSKYFKGDLVVLDFSWYSQYKPYGDLIFTGFAYILFIYRLYVNIPNIIQGNVNSTAGQLNDIEAYSKFGFTRDRGNRR